MGLQRCEVMRQRLKPQHLFLLSVASVTCLALTSSPAGITASSFRELAGDEPSIVLCTIVRCRATDNGWLLNLSDTAGERRDAFCPYGSVEGAPSNGSAARVWAQPSDDDPTFLFIGRLEVLPAPVVKSSGNND